MVRTQPVIFSPIDPHTLYFAANTLWKTRDGGRNWQQISPDLTRKTFDVPDTIGKYKTQPTAQATQRGVIYTVAPSPLDAKWIWVGTDDGLIQLTTDEGAHWKDVTPPQLKPWQKVSIIDASHFDSGTAYAAVNTIRLDDLRPHIYRTRDSGATWTEITNGIPANENVNAVREDPKRKGLLFAGTERTVHVSFDDGEHWQSLRLDLAPSSVRDLIIKDDDLCVATHGRGFWILDNITPLRQLQSATSATTLFQPQTALRVRWNLNTDTPLPPDEPAGENPPEGAMFDYYLPNSTSGPVTLEFRDEAGNVVRKFSSADPVPPIDPMLPVPAYWVRPPQGLPGTPGMHRFMWDLHYTPVPGVRPAYPIAAVYRNTAPDPTGPWATPGTYTVVLTANSKTYKQTFRVQMDPRVKASSQDLGQQFQLSKRLYDQWFTFAEAGEQAKEIRTQLEAAKARATSSQLKQSIDAALLKLAAIVGADTPGPGQSRNVTMQSNSGRIRTLLNVIQDVDLAPTPQVSAAVGEVLAESAPVMTSWQSFKAQDVPMLNKELQAAGLATINF
jgi:photosystem II stability/assembly factor-like uncharacterized protein